MAVQSATVTATTTRQNLGSLVVSALGQTVQMGGTATPAPAPRFAQITLENEPGSAGNVYFGGANVTSTGGGGSTLAPGGSQNLGSGYDAIGDMSQLYLVAATGTPLVRVTWVD